MSSFPSPTRALLSCLAYGSVSIAMTLVNKSVAVIFRSPWGLIFTQNAIQTAVLCAAAALGTFAIKADLRKAFRAMAPLNVFFVAMLYTSMQALQRLPVPVVTVMKNCGNVLIVLGDWYIYDNRVSYGVVTALVMVVASAGLTYRSAATTVAEAQAVAEARRARAEEAGLRQIGTRAGRAEDFSASFSVGMVWMFANLLCTASYSLYARAAKKRSGLTPGGMSFVNGMLSLPVILFFSLLEGTGGASGSHFLAELPRSVFAASWAQRLELGFSGVLGCTLGACVFWCISETSPTTLSFVGALNKLPLAILGAAFFGSVTTSEGWFYILLNVAGSIVYVMAKAGMLGEGMNEDVCGAKKIGGRGRREATEILAGDIAKRPTSESQAIELMEGGPSR
jgi:GDP-mannose transporter